MRLEKLLLGVLIIAFFGSLSFAQDLVPNGATWKYLDDGSDQGVAWRDPLFSDSNWKTGAAGKKRTLVNAGTDGTNRNVTYYFRHTFDVPDADELGGLELNLVLTGGSVVYINGKEVFRSNLPDGSIHYMTEASASRKTSDSVTLSPDQVVSGTNTIAVEMHQDPAAPDATFDLSLTATDLKISRGPYIQMINPTTILIRWRTSVPTDSRIFWSDDEKTQNLIEQNPAVTTEHSIVLSNLRTAIPYYYRVGNSSGLLKKKRFSFVTPPDLGHPHPSRFWILGDVGSVRSIAKDVYKSYKAFNKIYTSGILFLGDDAYVQGADLEFQKFFFKAFKKALPGSIMFSALGEHDTGGLTDPPATIPYFLNFDPPGTEDAGGWPSGTEKYYSFDYGAIHFVVLDSMASSRAWFSPMLNWLREDMDNNHRPWTIAMWHHSPYSKGNHDSDAELEMIEMRQNAARILENRGVDLVLTGHSNSYERSYFIDGHYGMSNTFGTSMVLNGGDGRPEGDGAYKKDADTVNSGTVYVALGSSGAKATAVGDHPAIYSARSSNGSLVLDISCGILKAQFLTISGAVQDSFTILKNNIKPTVGITNPSNGASFNAPANITFSATAADPDSRIRRVRFMQNGVFIDSDYSSPFSIQWSNVKPGTYTLTALVEDDLCGSMTSAPITVTVH